MKAKTIPLDTLDIGKGAIIDTLQNDGSIRRRLIDLGFVKGNEIWCMGRAPLGDPTAFYITGTVLALRDDESRLINVIPIEE